jgi:hypothetical protein
MKLFIHRDKDEDQTLHLYKLREDGEYYEPLCNMTRGLRASTNSRIRHMVESDLGREMVCGACLNTNEYSEGTVKKDRKEPEVSQSPWDRYQDYIDSHEWSDTTEIEEQSGSVLVDKHYANRMQYSRKTHAYKIEDDSNSAVALCGHHGTSKGRLQPMNTYSFGKQTSTCRKCKNIIPDSELRNPDGAGASRVDYDPFGVFTDEIEETEEPIPNAEEENWLEVEDPSDWIDTEYERVYFRSDADAAGGMWTPIKRVEHAATEVASAFHDGWDVIVTVGPYRIHDVMYQIDAENKRINLDYYSANAGVDYTYDVVQSIARKLNSRD